MGASARWLKKSKHVTSANFERRNRKCWDNFGNLSLIGIWVYFVSATNYSAVNDWLLCTSVSILWPPEVKPFSLLSHLSAFVQDLLSDILEKIMNFRLS